MGGVGSLALAASRLCCMRGGRLVFSDLSFDIAAGQALAVVGPNGAGKTSLLRILAGVLRPSAGKLSLVGGAPDLTVAEQVHYLGHLDALKPSLTVAENLAFWVRFLGGAGTGLDALSSVGLASLADLPAAVLSAGQRRRLSLARLIAVARPIWLLDEPTATLDTAGQEKLGELMQHHLSDGGIIVAATHGPLPLQSPAQLRIGGG